MMPGSGIPLKYFMWRWQHTTQKYLQRYAENLFKMISPTLRPTVFLLGILREEREGSLPICIHPESCGIDVESFNDVDTLANSIYEGDPGRRTFHGAAHVQEKHEEDLLKNSVRTAVIQLIDKNFEGQNIVSFVSPSVNLENYEVFVVLQFDKDIYDSFYRFEKNSYSRSSLLDSVINEFLIESMAPMYKPRAAKYEQSITTDKREILRTSASRFVSDIIFAVCEPRGGVWGFFDTCNYISSLKYEGDESIGKMIVCKENHQNLEVSLKLKSPVQLNEHRKVRKLLEVASRDLFLHSDGQKIFGLAKIKETYDPDNKDLLIINFSGAHKWELVHAEQIMMSVEYTNPGLPKSKIDKETFDDLLKRTFLDISESKLSNLWKIVMTATEQKHGTLLIISSEAETESVRLANQSTTIEPTKIDESLIRNITSIDGAILLDGDGVCHSIGVILDGKASPKGDSSRGARYNSAVRYVENNRKKRIAIIISEDGMVDLYPSLMPRIKKSDIEKYINDLQEIAGKEKIDNNKYRITMNWFEDHKFYLTQNQCDEINQLKLICNEKEKQDPYQIFILYPNLNPSEEMDDSYFHEE